MDNIDFSSMEAFIVSSFTIEECLIHIKFCIETLREDIPTTESGRMTSPHHPFYDYMDGLLNAANILIDKAVETENNIDAER